MAVTCKCRLCGYERELEVGEPILPYCNELCATDFIEIVGHILAGGDPAEVVEIGSALHAEALKEVDAARREQRIYIRDVREAEHVANRPKKLRALYPI